MKKIIILTGLVALILIVSCNQTSEPNVNLLDAGWKFKTGDDPSWATPAFDDASWGTIDPKKTWEEQGYKGYNGFAWYRSKMLIRSLLKDQDNPNDSLQIMLGKIDDCDQVFLNGEMIGENGRTLGASTRPSEGFIKEQGKWNLDRRYLLASTDPRIHWDKENLIAVRCYDQDGPGGMFGKNFEISMTGLKDHLKIDFTAATFQFTGDSIVTRSFTMTNLTGTEQYKGELLIEAIQCDNGIKN